MPYPTDHTYPAIATNAAWQKKKSFLDKAKAKNKTGVGPKLVAAELAWGHIPFADLDETKNKPTTSVQSLASLAKAKAAYLKVGAAHTAVHDAQTTATTQSTNAALTGTSKTALVAIVAALKAADKRLTDMSDLVPLFQVDHDQMVKAEKVKADKAKADQIEADRVKAEQAKANVAVITSVQVKSGSTVVATADKGTRQTDDGYWLTNSDWKTSRRNEELTFLQKKLTVEGKGKDGKPFSKVMTLNSIGGNGTLKFN